jgi:hypothetical protein
MHQHSRRGVALVVSTFLIVLLLGLSMSLIELSVGNLGSSERRKDDIALTVATESVANLSLNYLQNLPDLQDQLNRAKTWTSPSEITAPVRANFATDATGSNTLNGTTPASFWKYVGTVTVPIYGQVQNQDVYQISSICAVGGPTRLWNADGTQNAVQSGDRYRRRRVEALFTPFPASIFKQAMFAKRGFEFMGNASTDSWNSRSGAVDYATVSARGRQGDLSSEGDIIVRSSATVNGAVKPNINVPIPAFTYNPPGNATALGVLSSGTLGVSVPPPGVPTEISYRASALTLGNRDVITIPPYSKVKLYVDTYINLRNDWLIPKTSTLTIIQNNYDSGLGGTTINGNITVGCPGNPASFIFMSLFDGTLPDASNPQSLEFRLNGTAQFGGVLFAPYATMALKGNFDYFGALVADSFKDTTGLGKVNGSFSFHYDESLANMTIPFPPSLVIVGWRAFPVTMSRWRDQGANISWDDP